MERGRVMTEPGDELAGEQEGRKEIMLSPHFMSG